MKDISPKVSNVIMHENHTLTITFETGEVKTFDIKPYLRYEVFEPLKDLDEFKKYHIDFGTVCWECGAELSRDTFYIKGEMLKHI
ncbi:MULTISPECIES: DUF2442 domain-containing protein [Clostridium]|uniref:DUF2442 domain-containing protein n=1 Tax=Clostridium frigoriphilum TaxID=443253 RepID=A0ABU7UHR0_9CLOT|nr:DUF2442 domain-containing protein [Clostridium sp. DSM 17811]MBU3098417.1 DUF2442 domain-containing protein [Clostridium sp. DSM 17811]